MDQRIYDIIEVLIDAVPDYDPEGVEGAIVDAVLKIESLVAVDVDPPNIRYVNHVECVSVSSLFGVFPPAGTVGFSDDENLEFGIRIPKPDLHEWGVGARFQIVMLEAPHEG